MAKDADVSELADVLKLRDHKHPFCNYFPLMMDHFLLPASTNADHKLIADMALQLFPQVYGQWVDMEMVLYFVDRFQSYQAIVDQAATDFEYYLIMAEGEDTPLGYLGLQMLPNEMRLSKLYLMPNGQGKGLGDMAMEKVMERVNDLGYKRISLFVNVNNERAISFYKRHGYFIETTVVQSFDNGHSVNDHLMVKLL